MAVAGTTNLFSSAAWNFPTDGALAVHIFFVLSGFALSIGYVQSREIAVLQRLSVRRYVRLTIPIFAVTMLMYVLLKLGLVYSPRLSDLGVVGWLPQFYQFEPSFRDSIRFALFDVYFNYGAYPTYNSNLWTMSPELFGSFFVFVLLALCGSMKLRAVVYAAAIVLLWLRHQVVFLEFTFGVCLAELSVLPSIQRFRDSAMALAIALFAVGAVILASSNLRSLYGGPVVLPMMALALVSAPVFSSRFAAVFEARLSAFLGRVSFPLYLVQLPVISSISSYAFITMTNAQVPGWLVSVAVLAISVTVTIALAVAFLPIETTAIRTSRMISELFLNPPSGVGSNAPIVKIRLFLARLRDREPAEAGPRHGGASVTGAGGAPDAGAVLSLSPDGAPAWVRRSDP